jgi:hypothetical protein
VWRGIPLLFPDVFLPHLGTSGDIAFQQLAALGALEVDDFDAVFAQPIETARCNTSRGRA